MQTIFISQVRSIMGKQPFIVFCFCVFLLSGILSPAYVYASSQKIDSIQIVFDNQQLVLPGENFKIGILTFYKNGKISKTRGMKDGSTLWWNFKVEVTGGTFNSGLISVYEQPDLSVQNSVIIKAYPRKQPELAKGIAIPLNYETSIRFRPTTQFDKAPGSQFKGELAVVFDNGIQRIYQNLQSKKEAGLYKFSGKGGTWKNGKFTIETDIRKIDWHTASLTVSSLRNQSIADTFQVILDYKHNYKLNFSGSSGLPGFSGTSGSNGGSSMNGSDGQNGQSGEYGSDGPDIGIWADLYYDSILNCELLYVFAQDLNSDKEYRFLLNPDGGSIHVSSTGGSGGFGGTGGDGGAGGDGQAGKTWTETHTEKQTVSKIEKRTVIKKQKKTIINSEGKEEEIEVDVPVEEDVTVYVVVDVEVSVTVQGRGEDGGNGGWGGAGGFGGEGGYGGNITLYLTEDAKPYQNLILPESNGGTGGRHGSSGRGGRGGYGGTGNPSGYNGTQGNDGPYAIGWAGSGGNGSIRIESTDEFMQ